MSGQGVFNEAGKKKTEDGSFLLRTLVNTPVRREIRYDFPATILTKEVYNVVKTVREQLERRGTSLQEVGHITIAYPHKHPDLFPGYKDTATPVAHKLQEELQQALPDITWLTADGICETVQLARSENQLNVIHALTGKQIYDFHAASQTTPLPFLDTTNDRHAYFITVDSTYDRGTTAANMMSFIEHNGGTVLCNVAGTICNYFSSVAQREHNEGLTSSVWLPAYLTTYDRNNERLPELAHAFAKRAGKDWTPARCIVAFEEALNKNGHSVFALTQGECQVLIEAVGSKSNPLHMPFHSLLKRLNAGKTP